MNVTASILRERIHNGWGDIPPRPFIDFEDSDYHNTSTRMKFVDSQYGEWLSTPNSVLRGNGHKLRWLNSIRRRPEDVESKIQRTRPYINLDYTTFRGMNSKARFIDTEIGKDWWA